MVDEGHRSFGASAEIAANIAEMAFDYLDAPVKRYAALDVPVPFSAPLEDATIPNAQGVVELVRGLLERE